ncbi:STAS domain-containing protein [Cohnella hongkongensis]|uniref:STAS domain-containing protein n=1 Tax=Cohnella hongkongensis TaxID=178337 RepID=A0ABV9FIA0_9BACL
MGFEITDQDERITVTLSGAIGVQEATSIRQQLFPLIQASSAAISFHLGEVTEIDSSGLGLLLAVKKIASDCRSSVSFHDAPAWLRERLRLTGILL